MDNLKQIAHEMATYSDMLVNSGMLHLKGGNYSVRLGDELVITPTLCFKKDLVPEKLVRAPIDSDDPVKNASSVLSMHRAIYRKTDAQAIIHAHPYHPALLSFFVDEFHPVDENGLIYLGSPIKVVAAREFMGWKAVDEEMADALVGGHVAILKWHGTFATGDTLAQAFHHTQAIETAARFYLDTWRLRSVIGEVEFATYIRPPAWNTSP